MTETKTDHYTLAGWLAIVSAVLLIPEIGLAVFLGLASLDLGVFAPPIHIANLLISIYILYIFRRLLNRQFNFHATDILITILILANILFFVMGLLELCIGMFGWEMIADPDLSVINKILLVPFSLLQVVFGIVLLRLKDNLFGLLKPYSYTTIGSGVCGATVILVPIGLLAAVVALVILGMIFLRSKREAEIL